MSDLLLFAPKLAIGVALFVALAIESFSSPAARRGLAYLLAGVLVAGLVSAFWLLDENTRLWHDAFVVDRFSVFADIVLLALSALVVLASVNGVGSTREAGDFYLLVLLSLFGASALASAGNLIVIFLGVELAIIPTWALAAFRMSDRRSYEAALKYFLLSVFASALMLYGFSLVYGTVGTVRVPFDIEVESSPLLLTGIGLVLAGFGFKLAAFPFHQWLPDVFEAAYAEVGAFLAVAPKLTAIVALVRILDGLSGQSEAWTYGVAALATATMFFGTFVAFAQTSLKRMLAYSAVAHAGYALVGVAAGNEAGMDGAVLYFAAYGAGVVGAFLVAAVLSRQGLSDDLVNFRGLGRRRPALAAVMTVFLISLTGIPLFAGFWGKFSVFWGAVQGGLVWLAVIGVVNSAISFGFYGRVIQRMYLEAGPGEDAERRLARVFGDVGWQLRLALVVAVAVTFLLGVAPGLLFDGVAG